MELILYKGAPMFTYFIFDVDGTIVDTEDAILEALHTALCDEGITQYEKSDLGFALGIPSTTTVEKFNVKSKREFIERWENYEKKFLQDSPLFPGMKEVLETLKKQNCKLGVVTSRKRQGYEKDFIERFHLQHLINAAVCCDDVKNPKPSPESMHLCMEKLGASPAETIYTGDSIYDMQCAKGVPIKFALALWGAKTADAFSDADYIVEKPEDILNF